MRHSRTDHNSTMMHFKKRWLQQERYQVSSDANADMAETSYRQETSAPPSSSNLPVRSGCEASPDQVTPTAGYRHHEAAAAALNIPRFRKYFAPSPLQMQLSSESSALTDNLQSATSDQRWAASPALGNSLKLHLGSHRSSGFEKDVTHEPTERVMIDINKPPPSPTNSMDYEVSPTPGCESPSPSKTFRMPAMTAVMDYSLPASPSQGSWLSAGQSDDSGAVVCHPRGLPSGLLHLPFLNPQVSPPPSRGAAACTPTSRRMDHAHLTPFRPRESSQLGLSTPGTPAAMQKPSSPQQQLRRPRSQWEPAAAAARDLAVHHRCGGKLLGRQGSSVVQEELSHDDGDAEDDDDDMEACGKHESSGDEQLCRGGVAKSCLHCGTTKTPLWRNGPPGPKSVCNACGIRFNKIKSGKRKPTPKEAAMLLKYERSGSVSSTFSDVIPGSPEKHTLGGEERGSQPREELVRSSQQQQLFHRVLVPSLPVATVHKSRSRVAVSRQNSSSTATLNTKPASKMLLGFPLGKRDSPEDTLSFHAEENEADDELEGKPLRTAYQPRAAKKPCVNLPRGAELAHSPWDVLPLGREAVADCSGAVVEEHDDVSSSEHESCLSEHGASPPVSPGAWESVEEGEHKPALLKQDGNVAAELAAEESIQRRNDEEACWSEGGEGSEDAEVAKEGADDVETGADDVETGAEDVETGADDVEMGARLLMEIFLGAPALVHC